MKNRLIVTLNPVDLLTLSGLVLSLTAMGLALAGNFALSLAILYLAMLADAFDGIMARKFGTEREFGRYLDGFIDVFDYLLAPVLFLYLWGMQAWYYAPLFMLFIACGVIRLSVFNEIGNIKTEEQGLSYLGMPVFWSVLFLGWIYIASWVTGKEFLFPFVALLFGIHAVLMVYRGTFHKFKNPLLMLAYILGAALVFAADGLGWFEFPGLPLADRRAVLQAYFFTPHIVTALLFIIPPAIGGILHMVAVKLDVLPFLKIPLSEPLFGTNKTLRGLLLMPLFSMPGGMLSAYLMPGSSITAAVTGLPGWLFGAIIGLSYVLAELPNSFIKRRMGIAPGEEATRHVWFFTLMDQTDAAIGGAVVAWIYGAPWQTCAAIIILTPIISLIIKRLLYLFRLKKDYK